MHMKQWLILASRIDTINESIAKIARWSVLFMLGLGLWNVIGRYLGVAIGQKLSSNGLIEGQCPHHVGHKAPCAPPPGLPYI